MAKTFVTPDVIYYGIAEEARGLEDFKKWVAEDLSAFLNMQITILDEFGEQNKVYHIEQGYESYALERRCRIPYLD